MLIEVFRGEKFNLKRIKIHVPGFLCGGDEVGQIVRPGVINSELCELATCSLLAPGTLINNKHVIQALSTGRHVLRSDHPMVRATAYHGKSLPGLQRHINADGGITFTNEHDDIDVLLLHGSMPPHFLKQYAELYENIPIINLDYKDSIHKKEMFVELEDSSRVFNFKRSMTHFPRSGPPHIYKYPYRVHHSAYCVREDIYTQQNKTFRTYNNRELDVACFFPDRIMPNNDEPKVPLTRDKLMKFGNAARKYIGHVVDTCNFKTHVGYTGSRDECGTQGRKGVDIEQGGSAQHQYCDITTNTKIIVTACPPTCEGDYRLMEAMTSGALVMHNRMMLPPKGLIDEEHWIVYDNAVDLQDKLSFYVANPDKAEQIANTGRDFVLNNHRPHHRIEEWLEIANLLP